MGEKEGGGKGEKEEKKDKRRKKDKRTKNRGISEFGKLAREGFHNQLKIYTPGTMSS